MHDRAGGGGRGGGGGGGGGGISAFAPGQPTPSLRHWVTGVNVFRTDLLQVPTTRGCLLTVSSMTAAQLVTREKNNL